LVAAAGSGAFIGRLLVEAMNLNTTPIHEQGYIPAMIKTVQMAVVANAKNAARADRPPTAPQARAAR